MKLDEMLAKACMFAQGHIDDLDAWPSGGAGRVKLLQCTSYQIACFLAQNTRYGHWGVDWSVIIDELVEHPMKSQKEWRKIINDLATKLGGWLEPNRDCESQGIEQKKEKGMCKSNEKSKCHKVVLKRTGLPDVYFTGELLESLSTREPGCSVWSEYDLFRTAKGQLVLSVVHYDEHGSYNHEVYPAGTACELVFICTCPEYAKRLLYAAGYSEEAQVSYD